MNIKRHIPIAAVRLVRLYAMALVIVNCLLTLMPAVAFADDLHDAARAANTSHCLMDPAEEEPLASSSYLSRPAHTRASHNSSAGPQGVVVALTSCSNFAAVRNLILPRPAYYDFLFRYTLF